MQLTSETLEAAIEQLAKLPGVGRKSAQRLAMFLVKQPEEPVLRLAQSLIALKRTIRSCSVCHTITDGETCPICANPKRANGMVCVVEEPKDVYAIEKTGEFKGRYHVLGGVISPLENIGPEDIRVKELLARIHGDEGITELILALNPDAEGEATTYYLHKLVSPLGVTLTRIAHGIPMGAELEYIDEATLSKALAGRRGF